MICEKNKCTGCYACLNICPKNAIKMKEDELGYVYPYIDEQKCINCNLCKKVCPTLNNVEFYNPKKCYAMIAKDKDIYNTSTSGGAATVFSKYIIERKKGVVYGATYIDGKVNHIRIDNISELCKLQGSKYVHSYIENSYRLVKKDLDRDFYVLFIGTPCQIAGLKKYLNREYDKLIMVDLICHGVPSQKLLNDEIKTYNLDGKIDKITFRGKDGFKIKIWYKNNIEYIKDMDESMYYMGFMKALFYRENCYSCMYAKPERISDITIGDFWGLGKDSKLYSTKEKGVSILILNTEKGMMLSEECINEMIIEERNIEEGIKGNTQLRRPSKLHKNNKMFKIMYSKLGFKKAVKMNLCMTILKKKIKNNKTIYGLYKKMKG